MKFFKNIAIDGFKINRDKYKVRMNEKKLLEYSIRYRTNTEGIKS